MAGWQPTTCFNKILGLEKRIKAIYGGSSSGKTFNVLAKLYQDAVDTPGERITIASNTLANLKKGAVRDLRNILLSRDAWKPECWKKSESIYELKNGSIIEFIGLEDETKARGPRRERLFIDEANRVSFEVYTQLERRTETEVILSWNPSGPFWYNDYLQEDVIHDSLVVNFKDNEALSDVQLQYFADLEKQSTRSDYMMNEWKVYGLGEWGQVHGACIKDYKVIEGNPEDGFRKDDKAFEGFQLCGIGLDFGNVDPNAAVGLYRNDSNEFIVDEILYEPDLEISDIYDALREYDAMIYADYNFPQTIRELRSKGLSILKCKKGPDSIKRGIDLVNETTLYITERSKNLLNEFLTYRYKQDKDGNLMENKYEGPDHLVDSLRYVLSRFTGKRTVKIY
jgi:phage terminase large subunit